MKLPRPEVRKRVLRHGEPVILFGVADITFAIAATAVEEIRTAHDLRPLAQPPDTSQVAKVRYRLDRGGKTYWVVDASRHFHLLPVPAARVLVMRRHNVALLVDRIDLMAELAAIHALPRAFRGQEREWYRGLALIRSARGEVAVVPVLNPDSLLTEAEATTLRGFPPAMGATL